MKSPFSLLVTLVLTALATTASALPVSFVPWDQQIADRELAVVYGEKTQEIGHLHPAARSKKISVPAESESLRLVDVKNRGTSEKPLFASIKIPGDVKRPLVLIIPDEKGELGLKTFVIEDSPAAFPYGTFNFLNATGRELVFVCDKQAHKIGKKLEPSSFKPKGDGRPVEVKLFLPDIPNKPFYSEVWDHKDTLRQLIIIVPNVNGSEGSGPVDFKFVVEDSRDVKNDEE